MTAPYLEISAFASRFGSLSDADTLTATDLLQTVSDWIRGRKADADPVAAGQVLFEVVRDQLNLGEFSPLRQFENTTSRRTVAGTFEDSEASSMIDDVITARQKRLLGIALRAAPAYSFPVCDY